MSEENGMPSGWAECTIGNVASSMKNGIYKAKESYSDDGIPCLRMYNIDKGRLIWEGLKRMILTSEEQEEYGLLHGDLVVNRVNSRELVGKTCVIPDGLGAAVFESKNIRLRIDRALVDPYFLNYSLLLRGRHHFNSNAQQTVGMASINQDQVAAFSFWLPPLNEQRRIVAKIEELFSDLDAGVAALERAKANLKRYRASVLKAAVEGKLTAEWRAEHPDVEPASKLLKRILVERRQKWEADQLAKFAAAGKQPPKNWKEKYKEPSPPDTTGLPELPESWCWASVEQVAEFTRYGSSAKTSEDSSGVPVLRMGNIVNGTLDYGSLKYLPHHHDEFPDLFLAEGDLLFNRTNSAELVGKSAVYDGAHYPCSFASYLIGVRCIAGCESKFLCTFINSAHGRRWVKSVVSQQVGQANVNGTKLQALAIPLPPTDEQQEIVANVAERLSQIDCAAIEIERGVLRATRLRQSILKQAFEGKLVPQDPNDEPASVLLERIKHEREQEAGGKATTKRKKIAKPKAKR